MIAIQKALRAIVHHAKAGLHEVILVLARATAKTLRTRLDPVTFSFHCESLPKVAFAAVERLDPTAEGLVAL
jgi:hypothetical protein